MRISKKLGAFLVLLVGALLFPLSSVMKSSGDQIVLSQDNTIILAGEVDGESAAQVIFQAKLLGNKRFSSKKPLYLFLNTPGGSIQTGLEMIESLNGLGRPISTITLFAASMGFQIAQNLGERLILKNGVLMSHRAQGAFEGYFGGERPSQVDNRYNLWLSRLNEMDLQTVKRTNGRQTLDSYQKAYANELWLTGTQAVEDGYADRVVTVKCDSSLDGVKTHTIMFFGFRVSFDIDNCPLNTTPMNIHVAAPDEKQKLPHEKIVEVEAKFMQQYVSKHRSVIPMYW